MNEELNELILNTNSMTDIEKAQWIVMLPTVEEVHKKMLHAILSSEKTKLERLDRIEKLLLKK